MSDNRIPIKRALVSVYDKTGLEDLVRALHDAGVVLVSTGGSAALIAGLGLPVTKVEDLTGFPECLDGRVKTLHPRVHAGILADRRLDSHVAQLADLGELGHQRVMVAAEAELAVGRGQRQHQQRGQRQHQEGADGKFESWSADGHGQGLTGTAERKG